MTLYDEFLVNDIETSGNFNGNCEQNNCNVETHRKFMQRKSQSLTEVLEKAKAIRKSFETSNIELNDIVKTNLDDVNEGKMIIGICKFLKNLNCKDLTNRNLFCSLVFEIFGDEPLTNDKTLLWLCNQLGKKTTLQNWMRKYLLTSTITETRGRKTLPSETRQKIFDAWHENSVITVDRRNGRDNINVLQSEYESSNYADLIQPKDIAIERFASRNQYMVRCIQRVATKTVREMHTILNDSIDPLSSVVFLTVNRFILYRQLKERKSRASVNSV